MTKLSPRSEALAFRIWAYCQGVEWNCTVREIADALNVHSVSVGNIVRFKEWGLRLRASENKTTADRWMYRNGRGRFTMDVRLSGNEFGESMHEVLAVAGVPRLEARPE